MYRYISWQDTREFSKNNRNSFLAHRLAEQKNNSSQIGSVWQPIFLEITPFGKGTHLERAQSKTSTQVQPLLTCTELWENTRISYTWVNGNSRVLFVATSPVHNSHPLLSHLCTLHCDSASHKLHVSSANRCTCVIVDPTDIRVCLLQLALAFKTSPLTNYFSDNSYSKETWTRSLIGYLTCKLVL